MARTVSLRFSLEEADKFLKGLQGMGKAGEDMALRLDKAAQKAGASAPQFNKLKGATDSLNGSFQSLAGRVPVIGGLLQGLGPIGTAAAAGLAVLTAGLKSATDAAAEAEKIELRLGAVLKATGNAAGLTKAQLIDYANELQGSLKINDETLKESIAVLSTFRAVSGDTFKTGIKLAADLSAVFGGDLLSSTRQIGLAFQDPAAGMTALRRAGVTFTETQKDMIKSLQESGDLLGAQGIIVAELTQQVGGAAQAEAGGLAGATRGLANDWDDLLEAIGRTEAVMGPALFIVEKISSAIRGLASL
ncbi:MAG: hypothetical protein Dbin4_02890, partial [Alphaproteobacteria bacterium]|nr:hypothetical protein [Alphaproteobacteria bacterium]